MSQTPNNNAPNPTAEIPVRTLREAWRDMVPFMLHIAFYGTVWVLNGAYIALWLIEKDVSAVMIGTLLFLGSLVRITLIPILTELCDRLGDRWLVNLGMYCCLLLPVSLLMLVDDVPLWLLYGVSIMYIGSVGALGTVIDSYLLLCSKALNFYLQPVRAFWPLGAAVVSPILGAYFQSAGVEQFAPLVVGSVICAILSAFTMPRIHGKRSQLKFSLLEPLKYHGVLLAISIGSLTFISLGGFFLMASVYYIEAMGLNAGDLGWIISSAVVVEFVLLMFVGPYLRRGRTFVIFAMIAGLGILRYWGYLNATEFWFLLVLHAIHGIQFGMTHTTIAEYFRRHMPEQYLSSAQGIYDIFGALGLYGGATIAGLAYSLYGGQGMIWVSLCMVTITLSLSCYYIIFKMKPNNDRSGQG